MKPLVAIVGRPNVGKSMLFNKLCGQRLSIVEDTPGVTRDRLYAQCEWRNRVFDIVDTGGIEPGTDDQILSFMREQAEIAIQTATVVVFVCDVKTGMTAADQEVANMLLRARKPVVLAVNKADQVGRENPDIYEFYNLGLGDPIAVSAVHGHGTGDLLDACVQYFPPEDEEDHQNQVDRPGIALHHIAGKAEETDVIGGHKMKGLGKNDRNASAVLCPLKYARGNDPGQHRRRDHDSGDDHQRMRHSKLVLFPHRFTSIL